MNSKKWVELDTLGFAIPSFLQGQVALALRFGDWVRFAIQCESFCEAFESVPEKLKTAHSCCEGFVDYVYGKEKLGDVWYQNGWILGSMMNNETRYGTLNQAYISEKRKQILS